MVNVKTVMNNIKPWIIISKSKRTKQIVFGSGMSTEHCESRQDRGYYSLIKTLLIFMSKIHKNRWYFWDFQGIYGELKMALPKRS